MTWEAITLNDGRTMPGIAVTVPGVNIAARTVAVDEIREALDAGFAHIDVSGDFTNVLERDSLVDREYFGPDRLDVFVTTQWERSKHPDGNKVLRKTLKELGLDYVDLLLLKAPYYLARKDIVAAWAEMEKLKEYGLTKSIGVLNFTKTQILDLSITSKTMPVVNKMVYNPYSHKPEAETVYLCKKLGIVILAHKILSHETSKKNLDQIARRLNVSPAEAAQVPLVWAKSESLVPDLSLAELKMLRDDTDILNLVLTPAELASLDVIGEESEQRIEEEGERTKKALSSFTCGCFGN